MDSYTYSEHFFGYWTTVQRRSRGRCCKTSVAFAHTLRARKSSQWQIWSQYIQVWKLFKGGNHSRAETIRGNTVCIISEKHLGIDLKKKMF